MTMFGIDASSHQLNVDWATVDASTGFGWEKVTEGLTYVNPYWDAAKTAMLKRAAATGFVPGAYLFLRHGGAALQAHWFAANAGNLDGFALAIDAEPINGVSYPTLADITECRAELARLYPRHPVAGYYPHWYWGDAVLTRACDYLWNSHYVTGTGHPRDLYQRVTSEYWQPYGGFTTMPVLQFTSTAVVDGVTGLVDCSAYKGTPAGYRELVLPAPAQPPAPIPDWQVELMNRLPLVKYGDNDKTTGHRWVRRVQGALIVAYGQDLGPADGDGVYGAKTRDAVKRVLADHGVASDGMQVDRHGWAVLVTGADL